MNNPVNLGLSILDPSKTVIYEFWQDYVKPKYGENTKLCYMDTDSFIVPIKTSLNWQFWLFGPNLPKKGISIQKRKKWTSPFNSTYSN